MPKPAPTISVKVLLTALLLPVLVPSARAGEARHYQLDPVHTRVLVAVDHAGFSRALGIVSGSSGSVWIDAEGWDGARLDVRVPLANLDFGDARWNAAVQGAALLDGARHPQARFVSQSIEAVDAQHARVCGQLTLRGTTAPLCLDVTRNAQRRHPLPPFRRTAGFSATGTLSRSAFGIDSWRSLIGDAVEVRIEAEAVRARAPQPEEDASDAVDESDEPLAEPVPPSDENLPSPATIPMPETGAAR